VFKKAQARPGWLCFGLSLQLNFSVCVKKKVKKKAIEVLSSLNNVRGGFWVFLISVDYNL
jgi:hypothetical protein